MYSLSMNVGMRAQTPRTTVKRLNCRTAKTGLPSGGKDDRRSLAILPVSASFTVAFLHGGHPLHGLRVLGILRILRVLRAVAVLLLSVLRVAVDETVTVVVGLPVRQRAILSGGVRVRRVEVRRLRVRRSRGRDGSRGRIRGGSRRGGQVVLAAAVAGLGFGLAVPVLRCEWARSVKDTSRSVARRKKARACRVLVHRQRSCHVATFLRLLLLLHLLLLLLRLNYHHRYVVREL